jgi:hypothetical protein
VELNLLMRCLHFFSSSSIPHFAYTLNLACILLWVQIAEWSPYGSGYCFIILCIINISSHMYLKFNIFVDKMLMPLSVDVQVAKDINIMVGLG